MVTLLDNMCAESAVFRWQSFPSTTGAFLVKKETAEMVVSAGLMACVQLEAVFRGHRASVAE